MKTNLAPAFAVLSLSLALACGGPPPAGAPAAAPATTTAAPEKRPPDAALLDAAEAAIAKRDFATAEKKIAQARGAGSSERVAHLEASLHAYKGDYEAAGRALVEHLKAARQKPDSRAAFVEHNWLSIIRQAQGDLTGALAEADARTRAGETGTWGKADERATLTMMKETWHRAYLLRMYAQQATGSRRDAALAYAEEAREAYAALAAKAPGFEDSVAVLEAFFAMHDGDAAKAMAAARRVDVAKNDDVEDLYLVYSALDAAGDREGAAAAKKRIDGVTYVSFAVPIVRTWIARDAEASDRRFSPRNPSGRP